MTRTRILTLVDGSSFTMDDLPKNRKTVIRFIDGSILRVDRKGNDLGRAKKQKHVRTHNIVTNYYGSSGAKVLQTNRAINHDTAIDRAFSHMRANDYEAFVAEVFNELTSELYAVITHSVVGEIRTMFHYDTKAKMFVTNFDARVQEEVKAATQEALRQEQEHGDAMAQISRIMSLPTPATHKE